MVLSRRTLVAAAATRLFAQEESFEVWREHPRILLDPQRLRRLRRERERRAPRWQQFEALIAGGARMPEPGFAHALYFQVTGDEAAAKKAVPAAGDDLRQMAIVHDWCQPHSAALKPRIEAALRKAASPGIPDTRDRALAAVSAGAAPELQRVVRNWWRGTIAPAIKSGARTVEPGEMYALFEILHAVRDNLSIELREELPAWFKQLPQAQVLSYYPAIYPAAENEYRIPAVKGARPDLTVAALSRAADLAIVAYDTNSRENQYLQGWALHDRFALRGAFGAPYEFLWANPYLPGLSYHLLEPFVHDTFAGRLFVRSDWQDTATWLGWIGGELQTFAEGEPRILKLDELKQAYYFGVTAVTAPPAPRSRVAIRDEVAKVFVVGLKPRTIYQVEPDDQEMHETRADPGGVLRVDFPTGFTGEVTFRPAGTRPGT